MDHCDIRKFEASDRDWLVSQHKALYARDAGFDHTFGELVADIVDCFLDHHDQDREAGWIAASDGTRLGSIFCVKLTEDTAKLRLFLLTPEARGRGLGLRLLQTCMTFAKSAGYSDMRLWTHESHRAACRLYRANGWRLESETPVHSFGQDLVEQSWSYRF